MLNWIVWNRTDYLYKNGFALNNLERLICYKTQRTYQPDCCLSFMASLLIIIISLTLSRHFSLSFIASGRSSGQHPVSSHSCCMYVRAGRPAFARPYAGVHRSTSLMSSSLLLQQCPACLVRLTWIVPGEIINPFSSKLWVKWYHY